LTRLDLIDVKRRQVASYRRDLAMLEQAAAGLRASLLAAEDDLTALLAGEPEVGP
jgi:hypothetical protein